MCPVDGPEIGIILCLSIGPQEAQLGRRDFIQQSLRERVFLARLKRAQV
jgi:hypothetical protein